MKLVLKNGTTTVDVVKRMVFLAFKACGGAVGMGFLQEMRLGGRQAEENEVWQCAYGVEDYPGGRELRRMKDNEVYCDYVFGRMMKWGCRWNDTTIESTEREFRSDYQSFCHTYPDNKSLAVAALESLDVKEFEFDEKEIAQ